MVINLIQFYWIKIFNNHIHLIINLIQLEEWHKDMTLQTLQSPITWPTTMKMYIGDSFWTYSMYNGQYKK